MRLVGIYPPMTFIYVYIIFIIYHKIIKFYFLIRRDLNNNIKKQKSGHFFSMGKRLYNCIVIKGLSLCSCFFILFFRKIYI